MSRVYDKPITIQKIDKATEKWTDLYNIHARINKTGSDDEYLNAGAVQAKRNLTFEVRYFSDLNDVCNNTQSYRIVYQGVPYNIVDFDDYMLQHKTIKFLAVSY